MPRILNSIRFFIILFCLLGSLSAQERPLITQSPEVLEPGKVSLQFGFDFLQDVKYPASGLRGDQTSIGVMGIYIGLGEIVEFEMNWTAYNFLSISERTPTPLNLQLNSSGTSTSDYGDLVLSTKILMFSEGKKRPSIAFLPGVQLPNASASKREWVWIAHSFTDPFCSESILESSICFPMSALEYSQTRSKPEFKMTCCYTVWRESTPSRRKLVLPPKWPGAGIPARDSVPLGTESLSQARAGIQVQAVGAEVGHRRSCRSD